MDDRIVKVLDYIEENLSQELTLEVLANVACISPSRFHRLFKQYTGKTPFKFIEEIRVTKAYDLVVREKSKVHELALQLGYKDYETFSRAFKKHFQLAPDDLRAIYVTLKNSITEQDSQMIIATVKDEKELSQELINQMLESKNIKVEEAEEVRIFKVLRVEGETEQSEMVIKNKFYLTPDKTIWKQLLKLKEE
jgi:AraC-like DNA-binding protein